MKDKYDLAGTKGTKKRIHVDRKIISQNLKTGRKDPPITIQTSKGSIKCLTVVIHGPSIMVYRPDKPLSCGARLWQETTAILSFVGK